MITLEIIKEMFNIRVEGITTLIVIVPVLSIQ